MAQPESWTKPWCQSRDEDYDSELEHVCCLNPNHKGEHECLCGHKWEVAN